MNFEKVLWILKWRNNIIRNVSFSGRIIILNEVCIVCLEMFRYELDEAEE